MKKGPDSMTEARDREEDSFCFSFSSKARSLHLLHLESEPGGSGKRTSTIFMKPWSPPSQLKSGSMVVEAKTIIATPTGMIRNSFNGKREGYSDKAVVIRYVKLIPSGS
ncbi:hypothetical protein Bca4012_084478 [Brassica carinata]